MLKKKWLPNKGDCKWHFTLPGNCFKCCSTSGITIENFIFGKTGHSLTSSSDTVGPRPETDKKKTTKNNIQLIERDH